MRACLLALIALTLAGCSATDRYGVYTSGWNSHGMLAVIRLNPDNTITGNSYASATEVAKVLAAGYTPNAGNYTGSFEGAIDFSKPVTSAAHANSFTFGMQWIGKGGDFSKPDPNYPPSVGSGYFDGNGTLEEVAAHPTAVPAEWAGAWIKHN